jgi:hypothetical protein
VRSGHFHFVLPLANTFFYNATTDWSSLPDSIRSVENIKTCTLSLNNENEKNKKSE